MSKLRDALFKDEAAAELPQQKDLRRTTVSMPAVPVAGSGPSAALSFTDSVVTVKPAEEPRSYHAFKQRIHTKFCGDRKSGSDEFIHAATRVFERRAEVAVH